jgi:hypothetical protein
MFASWEFQQDCHSVRSVPLRLMLIQDGMHGRSADFKHLCLHLVDVDDAAKPLILVLIRVHRLGDVPSDRAVIKVICTQRFRKGCTGWDRCLNCIAC